MSHRQFKETISLRYKDLKVIKPIITDIKKMLIQHPEVDRSQRVIVNFNKYNSSSLDILIDVYLFTISSDVFLQVKQDILLTIAEILEKNGAQFSYSTGVFEMVPRIAKKKKILNDGINR
jgi:MscS family membrane protein